MYRDLLKSLAKSADWSTIGLIRPTLLRTESFFHGAAEGIRVSSHKWEKDNLTGQEISNNETTFNYLSWPHSRIGYLLRILQLRPHESVIPLKNRLIFDRILLAWTLRHALDQSIGIWAYEIRNRVSSPSHPPCACKAVFSWW